MADELEVEVEQEQIRLRMDESREALAQKLELLEDKVTETVETATATVAEATEAVKETVQNATESVSETVDTVTTAVQDTVDSVRQSVESTVDTVKDAFDLSRHVNQHPWLMMAGAVAVGYVGSTLLDHLSAPTQAERPYSPSTNGAAEGWSLDDGESDNSLPVAAADPMGNGFGAHSAGMNYQPAKPTHHWLNGLGQAFGPEISKLQGLALGIVLGSVKELLIGNVPQPIQQPLAEVINGFTERFGATSINGSMLHPDSSSARTSG